MAGIRTPLPMRLSLLALLGAAAVFGDQGSGRAAGDWPQFRGLHRDGVAPVHGLARRWRPEGPPVVFRRPIGEGFSGVAAAGGRLYTLAQVGDTEDLLCLDATSGATLWSRPVGKRFTSELGNGPRSTPTVQGETVYAVSADLQLVAAATADGALRWSQDLTATFGAAVPRFGFAPSPLVVGDLLVLEVGGGEGRGVAALDRRSGAPRWTALDGTAGSSSPIVTVIGGVEQIVFHRPPEVVALSTSGQLLWRHPSALDAIVMPVALPGGRIFISSATMERGGVMLRITPDGDGFAVAEEWAQLRMRNHFNTAVYAAGTLYGFDNATLSAVDAASGTRRWAVRGFGKGSVVVGDGLLFVLADDGVVALAEATPEAYHELGRAQVTHGRSWTAPTLAGRLLVVRDHDEIVGLDVGPAAAAAARPLTAPAEERAGAAAPARGAATPGSAAEVAERYAAARGGTAAWRRVRSMRLRGRWATFSEPAPFVWLRRRGTPDLYRLEHRMLGFPFLRGRDADGLWWESDVVGAPRPVAISIPDYLPQLEREAAFEPALLDWREKGIQLELLGAAELDGRPTIGLRLTLPGKGDEAPRTEVWHLDPASWLEVAVDDTVVDATQGPGTFARRTYYADFRTVGGLVLPFRLSSDFGARLEEIEVHSVELDPELPPAALARPAPDPPPAAEAPAPGVDPPR